MPTPPLVSARWRPGALGAVVLAVGLTAWLSVLTYDAASTRFDDWALRKSLAHLGADAAGFLLDLSEPRLTFGIIALVALGAVLARHWPLLILSATGPGLAIVATEYVLKPVIGRYVELPGVPQATLQQMFSGTFPSGHETGVASAAVLVLVAFGQLRLHAVARATVFLALVAWLVLAAAGLVRNFYHYATDTIGSVGVSVAVVLGAAMAIDVVHAAIAARGGRRREPAVLVS
jgi:PAP2 superfamily